jgi:hypothetical protein
MTCRLNILCSKKNVIYHVKQQLEQGLHADLKRMQLHAFIISI